MLQDAAPPDRRGLLIFRHAHALAAQIGGRRDAGVGADQDAGMEELARRKHRQRDPRRLSPRGRDDQRRHRHFRDVELAEAQLAPEHLGRMHGGGKEAQAFRLHAPVDQRPRVGIVGEREAQFQLGGAHSVLRLSALTIGCHFAMSLLIRLVKSCGVPPSGSELSLASAALNSGVRTVSLISALSLAMISGGVLAGASSPVQLVDEKPGKPLSIMVGTSGSSRTRFGLVTASARSFPAWISGSSTLVPSNVKSICPATTSLID